MGTTATAMMTVGNGPNAPEYPLLGNGSGDESSKDQDRHQKRAQFEAIQQGLQDLVEIGSSTHVLTLAAVALCELRIKNGATEDTVLTPRCVADAREELSGDTRSHPAIRNSMQHLEAQGLIDRIDLRPDARRGRHDWSVSEDGWRLLRITNGREVLRQIADLEQGSDEYEALIQPLREALQDILDLDSTTHLVTLACIAALEEQDGEKQINVPLIYRTRRRLLGYAQTMRTRYHSVDELVDEDLVEKRDIEPESNRRRMDIRLTEDGWRFLQSTQAIVLIHELARLLDDEIGSGSGAGPAS